MSNSRWPISPRFYWLGLLIACILATAMVVIGLSFLKQSPWGELTTGRVLDYASEQCEGIAHSGVIRQQANFWSNFAYLAFGFLILFRRGTVVHKSVGAAFVFLAICSGLFHGTLTEWGQFLDVIGIYVLLLLLILHGVYSAWNLTPQFGLTLLWIGLFTALGLVMGLLKNLFFDSTPVSFAAGGILLAIGLYGSGRRHRDWFPPNRRWYKWFVYGLVAAAAFGGAVAFKFLDGKQVTIYAPKQECSQCDCKAFDEAPIGSCTGLCSSPSPSASPSPSCCDARCACLQDVYNDVDTTGHCFEIKPKPFCFGSNPVIQGHALWHLLSALGLFFIFEFFDSLFE